MNRINGQFMEACRAQGIDLQLNSETSLATAAVALHAELYSPEPDGAPQRSDQIIDINRLPDDPVMRLYGTLLNSKHGKKDDQPYAHKVNAPASYIVGDCEGVESAWSRTLQRCDLALTPAQRIAARLLRKPINGKPLVQVFVNDEGQPTIIRKGRGKHPSAILLQSVQGRQGDHDITYPALSVVTIDTSEDATLLDNDDPFYAKLQLPSGHSLVSHQNTITGLTFNRLTPMVYPSSLRDRDEQFPIYHNSLTVNNPAARLHRLARNVIALHQQGLGE